LNGKLLSFSVNLFVGIKRKIVIVLIFIVDVANITGKTTSARRTRHLIVEKESSSKSNKFGKPAFASISMTMRLRKWK